MEISRIVCAIQEWEVQGAKVVSITLSPVDYVSVLSQASGSARCEAEGFNHFMICGRLVVSDYNMHDGKIRLGIEIG